MKRLLAILMLPFVLGCNGKDSVINPLGNDFAYPLAVGHKWQYSIESNITNFRPSKLEFVFPENTVTAVADIEIVRLDTLDNGVEAFVFSGMLAWENFEPLFSESYYNNLDGRMYLYPTPNQVGNQALPKRAQAGWSNTIFGFLRHGDNKLARLFPLYNGLNSITEEPVTILSYPLTVDKQWSFNEGSSIGMIKQVVGFEKVQVPAGEFDSVKIQWLFGNEQKNQQLEIFEFISTVGMVKRTLIIKDLTATSQNNEPLGLFDAHDEIVLTGFSL